MIKYFLTIERKQYRVKIRSDNPQIILDDIKTLKDLKVYKRIGFITFKEVVL